MNINFLNPFSNQFLQQEPEHSLVRKTEASRNSYGYGEDQIDWGALVNGYTNGVQDPGQPFEQSNIYLILFSLISIKKLCGTEIWPCTLLYKKH